MHARPDRWGGVVSTARLLIGDVFDRLAEIPDGSIDLVLTSPPFLALRSYLPADHPDKGKEIGTEPTPAEYLDTLLAVLASCRRVLARHGSIAIELGDSYSGSGGSGGDYFEGGRREGQTFVGGTAAAARSERGQTVSQVRDHYASRDDRPGWPLAKSLCGIPHLLHLSLAYGRNILTGDPSPAGQWRVRNVVALCGPNPPVGQLFDKFRPATSYMTIATIAKDRWFDIDPIRSPHSEPVREGVPRPKRSTEEGTRGKGGDDRGYVLHTGNPAGAPPLDHWWHDDVFDQDSWLIPTQPYAGSHYATWPTALCERPIQAMCPRQVCTTCGSPRRRIVQPTDEYADHLAAKEGRKLAPVGERLNRVQGDHMSAEVRTVGWTDCGHGTWRRGMVLDPFAGSGTTLAVATGHGRDAIGIDLDERNAALAMERVGPLVLEVVEPGSSADWPVVHGLSLVGVGDLHPSDGGATDEDRGGAVGAVQLSEPAIAGREDDPDGFVGFLGDLDVEPVGALDAGGHDAGAYDAAGCSAPLGRAGGERT